MASPAFQYISEIIPSHNFSKPLVVGISGVQGSGKSYLTSHLCTKLQEAFPHKHTVQFSMDDLYLTHAQQQQLNEYAPENNPLLMGRGLPGTHDIGLGLDIFQKLLHREPVSIPFYDKSCFNGEGDRTDSSQWQHVEKADIVLFEGWFNGFSAVPHVNLAHAPYTVANLAEINDRLREYEQIWALFDHFVFLRTSDLNNVYKWRLEQEHGLIAKMGTGMSDEQVVSFVNRYMPVYKLYYDKVGVIGESTLVVDINENREVIKVMKH